MSNFFFFIQSDGSAPADLSAIKDIVHEEQLKESMRAMRDAKNAQIKPILYERNGMICSKVSIAQLKQLVQILEVYGAPISKDDDSTEPDRSD